PDDEERAAYAERGEEIEEPRQAALEHEVGRVVLGGQPVDRAVAREVVEVDAHERERPGHAVPVSSGGAASRSWRCTDTTSCARLRATRGTRRTRSTDGARFSRMWTGRSSTRRR